MTALLLAPMYSLGTVLFLGAVALTALLLLFIQLRRGRSRRRAPKRAPAPASAAALPHTEEPAEETALRYRVGKLHQQGRRTHQQDAFGISDEALMDTHGVLAVVADGMGGLAKSDRVSVAAVETILDRFALSQGHGRADALLLELAAAAVQRISALLGPEELGKSGSTLVMALIRGRQLHFLSVGDSRICLLREGVLTQLNREQVYTADLALQAVNGQRSVASVFSDPERDCLISFLGMGALHSMDYTPEGLRLLSGDRVVLMSDGVYNALEEAELTALLAGDPEQAAARLQAAIEERDYRNQDNYTAIILECG